MTQDKNELLQKQQLQEPSAAAKPVVQQEQQQQPHDMPPIVGEPRSQETREAFQDWQITALRREVIELKETVDNLNRDKEKAMRWGIMVLGTAVLGMATWIFNLIFSHIKS